jgi:hypothetical protein
MALGEGEFTVGADPALRVVIVQYTEGSTCARSLLTPEQAELAAAAVRAAVLHVQSGCSAEFGPTEARTEDGVFVVRVHARSSNVEVLVRNGVTGLGFSFTASAQDVETHARWLELAAAEMKARRAADGKPLQALIDPFVTECGGELIAGLLDPAASQTPTQADYLFRQRHVIAELKALETRTFGSPFRRKMARLFRSWQERGLVLAYGTTRVDLRSLHPICQSEAVDVLAAPLQEIAKKANRQIGSTKELLGMPSAKGVLWVASDGNADLQPHDVWFLLSRVLSKKAQDGSAQYRHINAVIYFNPRMPVEVPGATAPGLVWFSDSRDPSDAELRNFLQVISESWIQYNERFLIGRPLARQPAPSRLLRFAGVQRALPRIDINDATVPWKPSKK